ncbi:hypothetical protein [Motilibacter aurantiacus]|uniref:hypothetical protein n=1 Tax=Motilibacter aurantiacus TaxID=2714955 RepID=UPI001408E156|nr:hypothetical protein [Motilibacter aurantiacus]NHC46537.1 hypothetical protein [Motilibacter aurantiacus]
MLLGLPLLRPPERVEISAPTGAHRDRPGLGLVRSPLPGHHVEVGRDGLRRTTAARTVLDLARSGAFDDAVAAADVALRHGLVTRDVLQSELVAMARWPGVRAARHVVEFADGRAESPGESLARVRLVSLGYEVDLQVQIAGLSGTVHRVDFLIDGLVVGEFDGQVKYADPAFLRGRAPADVLMAERRRQQDLEDAGRVVVRFDWATLHDDARLRRKVDAAVTRARRMPPPSTDPVAPLLGP